MAVRVSSLLDDALLLSEEDRRELVDRLLSSFHQSDPQIDALWAQEAESRLQAMRSGRMETFDANEVFADLDREDD